MLLINLFPALLFGELHVLTKHNFDYMDTVLVCSLQNDPSDGSSLVVTVSGRHGGCVHWFSVDCYDQKRGYAFKLE